MKRLVKRILNSTIRVYIQVKNPSVRLTNAIIDIDTKFEGKNRIGRNTKFKGEIGYGSYIGERCNISAEVGRFCAIGSNVKTLSATHPLYEGVSIHPMFYSLGKQNGDTYVTEQKFKEYIFWDEKKRIDIKIGNDVWIGDGVTIMGGISIGDGAVVATNATVTKDVLPYTIVAGVPAREINRRFSEEIINKLQRIQWWKKDLKWIEKNASKFMNVERFVNDFID